MKKIVSGLLLILLVTSMLTLAFNIPSVKATGTIYIRADGSIDPPTAPIQRDGNTYTFTDSISDSIVVQRSNIIIDGNGHTIQGSGAGCGFNLTSVNSVTIRNTNINGFQNGIYAYLGSYHTFSENNITGNSENGIWLWASSNNTVVGNNIKGNSQFGIRLSFGTNYNMMAGNIIENNYDGIGVTGMISSSNIMSRNNIRGNQRFGIVMWGSSSYNTVARNNITGNNAHGVGLSESSHHNFVAGNNITGNHVFDIVLEGSPSNNTFCHNNFNNASKVYNHSGLANMWDDGYPSGGNYWSDYVGVDMYSDEYQNESGSDEMGDAPYAIDSNYRDNYPLMRPWVPFENQTIYITPDGHIDPSGAPIHRKGNLYTLTGNISSVADGIVVQRSNIIVDGRGYTLKGSGSGYGFDLTNVNSMTITDSNINGFQMGVWVYLSSCDTFSGNNLTGNTQYSIWLYSSSNSTVTGNNIANNGLGIFLYGSSNNTVAGNSIENNSDGIILGDSSNNTISENNLTGNNYCSIRLSNSSSNTVARNRIVNNGEGISLAYSSRYNSISGNNITANTGDGVYLYLSSNNSISGNNIANNSWWGIWLDGSSNNKFYHNTIRDNLQQVRIYGESFANVWDDGYPSGGNYWSDYSGIDVNGDKIGDTPYVIDVDNQDNYPLMGPWTARGENVTVTPASGVFLTFANVTSEGITTINKTQSGPTPFPDYKIEGQYSDISTTASYSGNITIRLTYDDTNMTQQEEESLRLMHWNEATQQWEDITTHVDMESNVIYGETNHLSIFAVHSLLIHDLSIFGVHAFKTIIGQGYSLNIDVDVRNEGDFEETFDATVDLVSGEISYLSIFSVHLVNGNTMTLHFTWNTANSARDNYNIVAHVSQVPYEIDTSDNTYTDGRVTVTIPGDITGDFYVNIKDAAQIGANWGKTVPPTPPEADINGDGIINIKDAAIVGANWQKHA